MTGAARDDNDHLAREVVAGLEGTHIRSATELRRHVYDRLHALGLDIPSLVADARAQLIAEAAARVVRARTRQDYHQRRLEALEARAPVWPTAPTRERVARAGERPAEITVHPGGGGVPPVNAHKWSDAIERLPGGVTIDELSAAERVRWAYCMKGRAAGIADYGTGAGGSDPSRRAGLTPAQEIAGRQWHAFWYRMNPAIRAIVLNFVCGAPARGHDRPLTLEEFGRAYGSTTDPRRARGVAEGALRTALAVLAQIAREYDAWRAAERQAGKAPRRSAAARLQNEGGQWRVVRAGKE